MMMGDRSNNRCPFTASQWQELEHQTLIFKYMASGTPIPHDLLLPIRSFYTESYSTSATPFFPCQSSIGRGCYQMDFGRKGEDPEPGRCRRTDGKKWRCSKEAYPDSKYCERHMHRGKNRPRKHVEAPIGITSCNSSNTSATSPDPSLSCPRSLPTVAAHHLGHPFASAPTDITVCGFPPRSNGARFDLGTASSSADGDYRYNQGWRKDVDHYTFSEASTPERDGPWRLTSLGMRTSEEPGKRSNSSLQQKGGHFTAVPDRPNEEEREKRHHCFLLGADLKLERSAKVAREEEPPLPFHHFFADWPSDNKHHPWVDQEEEPGWGGLAQDPAALHLQCPNVSPGLPGRRLPASQW